MTDEKSLDQLVDGALARLDARGPRSVDKPESRPTAHPYRLACLIVAVICALVVSLGYLALRQSPHDKLVKQTAQQSVVGQTTESEVWTMLGQPDLIKSHDGGAQVEINYTPPGCSFFFDFWTRTLEDAECL